MALGWSSGADAGGTLDTAFYRNAAAIVSLRGGTDTTHSIIDHQSIDQIVDVIRGSGSRGLKLPGQTTQTQQQDITQQTQTLEPTGSDSQWNKAKEAGL